MTLSHDSIGFMKKSLLYMAALAIATTPTLLAAQQWQQTDNLQSTLGATGSYTYSAVGLTGTYAYTNQTATNVGPTTQHMGMYLGWLWSYNSAGTNNPLLWSNGDNAFVGGPVSLKITRPGFAAKNVLLSTVADDSWIGVPYGMGSDTKITTQGNWNVPLFDFGTLAAGASTSYDITFAFTFNNASDFDDWNRGGDFYVSAQGVQTVTPEPATVAMLSFALLGLAVVARRKKQSRAV